MFARTQKPLMVASQYQLFTNSTITASGGSSLFRPLGFTPFQQWGFSSTDAKSDNIGKPSTPSTDKPGSVRSCESDTHIGPKKLFVIAPSKSLSSMDKQLALPEEPIWTNPVSKTSKLETKISPTSDSNGGIRSYLVRIKTIITVWIESLKNQNWTNIMTKTKDQIVAPGNVERARQCIAIAWDMSVRTVQNLIYWSGVFLNSREYFYLRYYSLLLLENTIRYIRLGLAWTIQMVRNLKK